MSSRLIAVAGVMVSRFSVMACGMFVVLRGFSMMVYVLLGHPFGGSDLEHYDGGPRTFSSPILFTKGCSCFPRWHRLSVLVYALTRSDLPAAR
jgi:hypothetical protein